MIAFRTFVVQFSPQQKLYSGWSETSKRGVTHVTGGRRSSRMCRTRFVHREAVARPSLRVAPYVGDGREGVPEVTVLVWGSRVAGPWDPLAIEEVARGLEVETRKHPVRVALRVLDAHEGVAERVAPPSLEQPSLAVPPRQLRAVLDGVLVCAAGPCGDREQVVGKEGP